MNNSWMKQWLTLAAGSLLAVALAGLSGCASGASEADPDGTAVAVTPELLEQGAHVYQLNCAPCHGEGGRGDGHAAATLDPKPRDHTNLEYMQTLSDRDIAEVVQYGGAIRGYAQMPSSPHIRDEAMTALVAFVRSLSQQDLASHAR